MTATDDRGELRLAYLVQTSTEAHPVSYPMSTGGSFPEGKAARV